MAEESVPAVPLHFDGTLLRTMPTAKVEQMVRKTLPKLPYSG